MLGRAAVECRLRPLVDVVGSWSLSLLSVHGSYPVIISGAVFDLSLFKYTTICFMVRLILINLYS